MTFRTSLFLVVILASSTFACAGASGDDDQGSTVEGQDEAALSATAKKIAGSYASQGSVRPPTFQSLQLQPDGSFNATIDTGIRCITAPCDSSAFIYGTYTAGSKTITLKALDGAEASEYYGRYNYVRSIEGGLFLTRTKRGWSGWSDDLARAPGILPSDASKIVAESPGGGFAPPPPPGSNCAIGQQKYSLTVSTRRLTWTTCEWAEGQPLQSETGARTLSRSQVNHILDVTRAASITTDQNRCGADKPFLSVSITSPSGTKKFVDSFYACNGGNSTYIDGIDPIFGAFRDVAN